MTSSAQDRERAELWLAKHYPTAPAYIRDLIDGHSILWAQVVAEYAEAARCEERTRLVKLCSKATSLSMKAGQVVGEKLDYYITLQQLEEICKGVRID